MSRFATLVLIAFLHVSPAFSQAIAVSPHPTPETLAQPVSETPSTETATKAGEPVTVPTPAPVVADPETEALQDSLLRLDKVNSPIELFKYVRDAYTARKYQAAAMAFAFDKTKYATEDARKNCVANWNYIIDRIEDIFPQSFVDTETATDRYFKTAKKYIKIHFVQTANGIWQFGPESIAQTDELYKDVLDDRPIHGEWSQLTREIPDWVFKRFLGLSYFQWSLLLGGFLLGWAVYFVVQYVLYFLMRAYLHVMYKNVTRLSLKIWKQVASICMVYVWFNVFSRVVLTPSLYDIAYFVFATYATFMAILISMRLVDLVSEWLRIRLGPRFSEAHINNLIIPYFSRTTKVIVFCIGIISLASAFRLPIVGVLSGMGIGGIAIAFAAKETVANLFGSITVLLDRPFEIGDWIVMDKVEGTVEAVGMRSTRIRTFYNSVITIPNNNLTTAVIDNMGRRRYRRYRTFLTLQYENGPDRIDAFCEGVKELIMMNPFTLKENFNVCLYELQASSIDVLLSVFFVCPTSATEYRERAKLLKNILKLAEAMDIRFAYPTQTIYMNDDKAPPFYDLPEGEPIDIGKNYANHLLYPDGPPT